MEGPFLFTDTETTDFPKRTGGPIQEGQARVCQIAMLLTDSQGKEINSVSSLIRPEGWTISESAFNAHHISMEKCFQFGLNGAAVFRAFMALASKARFVVAFNAPFDQKMLEIECAYSQSPLPATPWHCAMMEATPWCELPPTEKMLKANMKGFKNPNLTEAYRIICGKELGDDAHDALWDVRAMKDVFFKIRELRAAKAAAEQTQGELLNGTT